VNWMELIGPILILALIAAAVLPWSRPAGRIAIAACGGTLAFVPVGSTMVGGFVLALVGPVSAATIVLCAIYLRSVISGAPQPHLPSHAFLLCILITGMVFYPLTFGLTTFDPYDLGYRGLAVPGLMFGYLLIGWFAGAADVAAWIGLAALLYLLDANSSSNLWDYLLFPFDVVAAAVGLALAWTHTRRSSGRVARMGTKPKRSAAPSIRSLGSDSVK
jgi:hypothetical protein